MIIPAIDIINGHAVRLYQGNYKIKSNYGDPILILQKYIQDGAKSIHLVDLDGARNPINRQNSLIHKLIRMASFHKIEIQIGGGIRKIYDIETLLELGASRVILGSTAITNVKLVKQWFNRFDPKNLILAIDIRINSDQKQKVVIHGWKYETNIQLQEIIEDYNSVGLKYVLCTDTLKDGTLLGSNINLYQSICCLWPKISFQASGGVANLKEISKLKHSGIDSIIIGRAFLEKKFTFNEAKSCWQKE